MAARYLLLAIAGYVSAQTGNANFNQVINLNGDMNLNSIQFPDGSRIEAFSQTQRQLLVNQNQAPLPGNQVTGSTGNPFMQLTQNSLIIQTNGGTDLVGAQIELPINQQTMQQNNINPDNTYVAKLAPDRQSWMIMETIKSVNGTDNTVRLVKMNNIDGEYIALGRQTRETSLSLTQFSTNLNQGFNVTGSGIQENEFTDGFRMSVRSTQPMLVNANVVNGVSSTMMAALGPNVQSVNNYRYLVSTNLGGVVPNINRMVAVVQLPINAVRLQTVAKNQGAQSNSIIRLSIAQRGILANPGGAQGTPTQLNKRQNNTGQTNTGSSTTGQNNNGNNPQGTTSNNPAATRLLLSPTFTPIAANAVLDQMNGRLAIPISQLDGEYIITVQNMDGQNTGTNTQGQQQGGQTQGQGQQQGGQIQGQGQQQGGQIQGQGQQQGGQIQGQGQQQGGQIQGQGQQPSGSAQEPQGSAPQAASPSSAASPQGTAPQVAPQGTAPTAEPPAPAAAPQGTAPQAAAPQAAAPQAAAPQGSLTGAAPAAAPQPAGAAPGLVGSAPAPAAAAPASQASGSTITQPIKRQLVQPAAAPAAAPLAPAAAPQAPAAAPQAPATAQTNGGGVMVSMAWVNMMARIQTDGLPVDVGAMMEEFAVQQGASPAAATDPLASLGL